MTAPLGVDDAVGMASALVIAGVFIWAGLAKLTRPATTAASFAGLGIPAPQVLARAVPAVEIGIAVFALAKPRLGSWAAGVLLVLFSAVLAVHVRRGSNVSCGCFGSADPSPVSWVSIARNAGLVVLAVCAAVLPTRSVFDQPSVWPVVVSALSIGAAGALLVSLLQMQHDVGATFSQRPLAHSSQTATAST